MPRKFKCYFGCPSAGPLHRFPSPHNDSNEYKEKRRKWLSVLDSATLERGEAHIESLRLCNKHFDKGCCLPSNKLTKNAIPTFLGNQNQAQNDESPNPEIVATASTCVPVDDTESCLPLIDIQNQQYVMVEIQPSSQHQDQWTPAILQPSTLANTSKPCSSTRKWRHRTNRNEKLEEYTSTVTKLRKKLENITKKYKSTRQKLLTSKKISSKKYFLSMIEKLPEDVKSFVNLQFEYGKNAKDTRFTSEEKIIALTILKQSFGLCLDIVNEASSLYSKPELLAC